LFLNITETSNILPSGSLEEKWSFIRKQPAFKSMVSALRQKADGKEIKPVWQEAYRWFAVQDEWRGKCEALRAAFNIKI